MRRARSDSDRVTPFGQHGFDLFLASLIAGGRRMLRRVLGRPARA
jgi:hypothetical protein